MTYDINGIKVKKIQTVFHLLSLIEEHPEEYLGGVTDSGTYASLIAFLTGVEYSSFYDNDVHSLKSFKAWAYNRYVKGTSDDFYGWLDKEYGYKQAFVEFFKIVDLYKSEVGI